ncbi:MAG: single-stranded-DNA-specific exonuclease RecJ [Flavobacteriales bacterium]|nr:single-stranded-DNA-specific exonuclease RecJ [Flavobacteriales bacterium]MBT6013657.1 single-stranded-DNA-specific exonuclease RecJ [Flavobacteriales bacterium]MBT7480785.1 single-stranded-DNA-specific exonuclease RecJ [Flavobacteriales bacterium]
MEKKWTLQKSDENLVENLSAELKVNKIVAHLLVLRGISTYEQAEKFFRPDIKDLHDPFLMKGMKDAVDRIELAIKKGEKILVYGDYDVDGTTSVSMMYSFLTRFSEKMGYYIPDRYDEGYGISLKGIDYAQSHDYSLIISLDCGIRAVKQVEYASNKNIDFIICDHHTPGLNIPRAISILNPKQLDCDYPYKELSGCGVGFKLIQAYSEKNNIDFTEIAEYLDLLVVSIGADIVEMTGENRIMAYYGLKLINSSPRTGIKALMIKSGKTGTFSISDVVFGIAPRINAAGRIEHGKRAVEILIEEDTEKVKILADGIENYNLHRKELDKNITEEALDMIDQNKKSTVVFSADWHKGVVGIVASRLIESHYKPTIVLSEKDDELTGSARSVKGFDLYNALLQCEHLLEKFGGHKYAAGLTVKKSNLDAFIKEFEKVVSKSITSDQLEPEIEVDMEIDIKNVTPKLYRIIKQFAPFGPKNRTPNFVSKGVQDCGYGKKVGSDKSHLRLVLNTAEDQTITSIGFGMADCFEKTNENKNFDICYTIDENKWQGKTSLQIKLKDLK